MVLLAQYSQYMSMQWRLSSSDSVSMFATVLWNHLWNPHSIGIISASFPHVLLPDVGSYTQLSIRIQPSCSGFIMKFSWFMAMKPPLMVWTHGYGGLISPPDGYRVPSGQMVQANLIQAASNHHFPWFFHDFSMISPMKNLPCSSIKACVSHNSHRMGPPR